MTEIKCLLIIRNIYCIIPYRCININIKLLVIKDKSMLMKWTGLLFLHKNIWEQDIENVPFFSEMIILRFKVSSAESDISHDYVMQNGRCMDKNIPETAVKSLLIPKLIYLCSLHPVLKHVHHDPSLGHGQNLLLPTLQNQVPSKWDDWHPR